MEATGKCLIHARRDPEESDAFGFARVKISDLVWGLFLDAYLWLNINL